MVEQKATQVCLVAQEAYPEARRPTLVSAPPIGYLLRIERETDDPIFRCIYSVADGRKIHSGPCRFETWSPAVESDGAEPSEAAGPGDSAGEGSGV